MSLTTPLWRLEEAPELFLDSYVADGDRAVFLSLWGRDTAIHELMAKLTLPIAEGGDFSIRRPVLLRFFQARILRVKRAGGCGVPSK